MHFNLAINNKYLGYLPTEALGCTLGRRKEQKTFPKSVRYTLEYQKRPKVLPMSSSASLKYIIQFMNDKAAVIGVVCWLRLDTYSSLDACGVFRRYL